MSNRPTMSMAVNKEHYLELLEDWLDEREANINKDKAKGFYDGAKWANPAIDSWWISERASEYEDEIEWGDL